MQGLEGVLVYHGVGDSRCRHPEPHTHLVTPVTFSRSQVMALGIPISPANGIAAPQLTWDSAHRIHLPPPRDMELTPT